MTYPQAAAAYPTNPTTYPQATTAYPASPTTYPTGCCGRIRQTRRHTRRAATTYPTYPTTYPPAAAAYPANPATFASNPTTYPQVSQGYGQPQAAIAQSSVAMPAAAPPAVPTSMPYVAAPIQVYDPKTGQMSTGLVSGPHRWSRCVWRGGRRAADHLRGGGL